MVNTCDYYNRVVKQLKTGQTLYTTSKGTEYKFNHLTKEGSINYQIIKAAKSVPIKTICAAKKDYDSGISINREWLRQHDKEQLRKNPCNVSVIKSLLFAYK